jgi:hypothetical protein
LIDLGKLFTLLFSSSWIFSLFIMSVFIVFGWNS